MSNIKVLSKELTNLIAAGEVIERPSSVVKELVENSLDANATNIFVEIQNGGIDLISVSDNGDGIAKDEIILAVSPHATSKINLKEDLYNIHTLGFRGEALASIASVSKLSIKTATKDGEGTLCYFEEGKIIKEELAPAKKGTTIKVENLFFNTPARFKHFSKPTTENSYITNLIYKFALANPDIAFRLIVDGKEIFASTGDGSIQNIIFQIYGMQVISNLVIFSFQNHYYKVSGYTSNNNVFRSNKNSITIILNKRIIANNSLYYAIMESYKSILVSGHYPICVMNIECPYDVVDINVHPSKAEVRFSDEYNLKQMITNSISGALLKGKLIYEAKDDDLNNLYLVEEEVKVEAENKSFDDVWSSFKEESPTVIREEKTSDNADDKDISDKLFEDDNFFKNLHYLSSFKDTYLIMQDDANLYLIDQHAAMERVMYEKILASLTDPKKITSDLLVPISLNYSYYEVKKIERGLNDLKELGIDTEIIGDNLVVVRSLPDWIIEKKEQVMLEEVFALVLKDMLPNKFNMYKEFAADIACKKSIKANMRITLEEVNTLIDDLSKCDMPFTCPHGRPVIVKITLEEIEKMFKRIV